MTTPTLSIEQNLAEIVQLDPSELREIYTDFDGVTEWEFEQDELYVIAEVEVYAHSHFVEEWGMDYDVSIRNIEIKEAWVDGEPVEVKAIQKLINKEL